MYSAEVIKADRLVSISVQEQRLDNVLNQLLSPLNISYRVIAQQIVLNTAAKNASGSEAPAAAPIVLGKAKAEYADGRAGDSGRGASSAAGRRPVYVRSAFDHQLYGNAVATIFLANNEKAFDRVMMQQAFDNQTPPPSFPDLPAPEPALN